MEKRVYVNFDVLGHWELVSTRRYAWDGDAIVAEFDGNNQLLTTYTWGIGGLAGGLLAVTDHTPAGGPRTYTVISDATGSVVGLVDIATGQVAASYRYDPYGNLLGAEGPAAAVCNYRFAGGFADAETGLQYHLNRYYDPRSGTWLSRDLIAEDGGVNLYRYCGSDPIQHADSSGLVETPIWLVEAARFIASANPVDLYIDYEQQDGGTLPSMIDNLRMGAMVDRVAKNISIVSDSPEVLLDPKNQFAAVYQMTPTAGMLSDAMDDAGLGNIAPKQIFANQTDADRAATELIIDGGNFVAIIITHVDFNVGPVGAALTDEQMAVVRSLQRTQQTSTQTLSAAIRNLKPTQSLGTRSIFGSTRRGTSLAYEPGAWFNAPKSRIPAGGGTYSTSAPLQPSQNAIRLARGTARPTFAQSETTVAQDFGWGEQQSYKDGLRVGYGESGSVRPDLSNTAGNVHVDVKNYNLTSSGNRASLYNSVKSQAGRRAANLPSGSFQGIVIDIRGQSVNPAVLARIPRNIETATGGIISHRNVVFLTDSGYFIP